MSKRYGRNQKRKHRERIAELEDLWKRSQVAQDRLAGIVRDLDLKLRSLIEEIRSLCPLSAVLPPKQLRDTYAEHYFHRIEVDVTRR